MILCKQWDGYDVENKMKVIQVDTRRSLIRTGEINDAIVPTFAKKDSDTCLRMTGSIPWLPISRNASKPRWTIDLSLDVLTCLKQKEDGNKEAEISINQSTDQSIGQAINLSIDQFVNKSVSGWDVVRFVKRSLLCLGWYQIRLHGDPSWQSWLMLSQIKPLQYLVRLQSAMWYSVPLLSGCHSMHNGFYYSDRSWKNAFCRTLCQLWWHPWTFSFYQPWLRQWVIGRRKPGSFRVDNHIFL